MRALLLYGFWVRFIRVPAYVLIGFWFVYQLVFALLGIEGGVAYFAHIGGFIAGLAIAGLLKRQAPARYNSSPSGTHERTKRPHYSRLKISILSSGLSPN